MVPSPASLLRTLLLGATLATAGCANPIAPDGAVPFVPPAVYRTWWQQTAECAGMKRTSFETIEWYLLPGAWTFADPVREGTWDYGLWVGGSDTRIYLAEHVTDVERHVKHEMMHAALRTGGHPPQMFGPRCGL